MRARPFFSASAAYASAATSRSVVGMGCGADGSTGTGSTTAGTRPRPPRDSSARKPPSLIGNSRGACATRRRSVGRCHRPWRPGRFCAAGESNQIAPGRGPSRAAVADA
jgi:hypothetical protein